MRLLEGLEALFRADCKALEGLDALFRAGCKAVGRT